MEELQEKRLIELFEEQNKILKDISTQLRNVSAQLNDMNVQWAPILLGEDSFKVSNN